MVCNFKPQMDEAVKVLVGKGLSEKRAITLVGSTIQPTPTETLIRLAKEGELVNELVEAVLEFIKE